jgi:DMSO/TMAO reductase YedYZ molybdopterin-dependent catalytic subunit
MKISNNRRSFIQKGIISIATVLGSDVVFAKNLSKKVEILGEKAFIDLPEGKNKDLMLLNDRPWNVETPPHLLDDEITPADKMFVRNNGNLPEKIDATKWELVIDGESAKTRKVFTLNDLKTKFKAQKGS